MDFLVLIPARYGSSRFPGKPLALLGGVPMIVRVCRQVAKTGFPLTVATDDERIAQTVREAGFEAVMTRPDHTSGTERVEEAYCQLASQADVVINVQGDEPFIDPGQIKTLAQVFTDQPSTTIATLARPFPADGSYEALADPNLVKVEYGADGFALCFSRAVIPFLRGKDTTLWPSLYPYHTHIGIYAYRADVLHQIVKLPPSPLEKAESLEQLRWLAAGYRIAVRESDAPTIGIDTPADLRAAESRLQSLLF